MELLKIKPVFKEMIWGGDLMKDRFHFDIPSDHTGEAWVISAHPNGDGLIENGQFAGQSLSSVYHNHRHLFGKGLNHKFPLLIKIIDAKQTLSVQVHPDDAYASKHEQSLGKTEAWYVLDCLKGTQMIIGDHLSSKDELRDRILDGTLESKLNQFDIKKDDFFYIPARTIHAICANSLIYEVQQNSDITYRVYDYDRTDQQGNKRELHIDQAIECANVAYVPTVLPIVTKTFPNLSLTTLIDEAYFSIKKAECRGQSEISIEDEFLIIGCIEGEVEMNGMNIKMGEHVIALNSVRHLHIQGAGTLMLTAPKERCLK